MIADDRTHAEVERLLGEYSARIARRDVAGLMELFAPDPDMVHIGIAWDEWCVGHDELREQFERMFLQCDHMRMDFWETGVCGTGNLCWVTANADVFVTADGKYHEFAARLSAVLDRRMGDWRFVHSHMSLPALEMKEEPSLPAMEEEAA